MTQKGGFTLLELLLAIVIVAMVVSAVYYSFSGAVAVSHRIEAESNMLKVFRTAADRIVDDVESLYQLADARFFLKMETLTKVYLKGRDLSSSKEGPFLSLVSDPYSPFGEEVPRKGPALISYELIANQGSQNYSLIRTALPLIPIFKERKDILLTNVRDVQVIYRDKDKGDVYEWDTASSGTANLLPRLVKIMITLDGSFWGTNDITYEIAVAPLIAGS